MNEIQKMDLRKAREWISGEVDIRLTRGWLVAGAVLALALVFVALD